MNLPDEDFTTRRERLTAQIARQRGELAQAYRSLEKPIRYAEYGLRGFGFLRANPWVIAAVPAGFSILSNLWGFRKKKSSKSNPVEHSSSQKSEEKMKPLKAWFGRAVQLYQLYRRVRHYFP